MYRSRLYNNGNNNQTSAYASFLDTYFEHVRTTNAMFRSIQETLHGPSIASATASAATATARTQQQQQQQYQSQISGQRAPARDARHFTTTTTTNTVPAPLARADDVDYISGVTFNIPIQDNDPSSIFSLLSAYVSAGAAAANTGAGTASAPAPAPAPRNGAHNTTVMRYSDISNNHRTYDACPITREPFATDERVLMLQCHHYFSENGLNQWLVSHSTCPVCRFNINNII
jgi:hypothetical protein